MTNKTNGKRVLPIEFNQSTEDLELLCSCGHFVNCHDEGVSYGSKCEEENCGCVSCEYDYELTIQFHYFQKPSYRWQVGRLTTDCKKIWIWSNGGLPMIKESECIEVRH